MRPPQQKKVEGASLRSDWFCFVAERKAPYLPKKSGARMDMKSKKNEKTTIKTELKKLAITLALAVVVGTICAAGLYFVGKSAFETYIEKVQDRISQ